MNSRRRNGKYSVATETGQQRFDGDGPRQQPDLKQCDYVSNRTRLRCRNLRKHLKSYGFCEQHHGYIERLRHEGMRAKQLFDPGFNFSSNFLDLISCDEDETLVARRSEDFPFVYESMYCDSRVDNDENPLRLAKVYSKKDIVQQYIGGLNRQEASVHHLRVIYREKHRRLLQQALKLKQQSKQTNKLNPVKDSKKIERLLALRRYALHQNRSRERALASKLTQRSKSSSLLRKRWNEQLDLTGSINEEEQAIRVVVAEMANAVAENNSKAEQPMTTELMRMQTRKRFMDHELAPPLPENIVHILNMFRENTAEEKLQLAQAHTAFAQQQATNEYQPRPSHSALLTQINASALAKTRTVGEKFRQMDQNNHGTYQPKTNHQKLDPRAYYGDGFALLRPSTSAAAMLNHNEGRKISAGNVIRPISIDEDINPEHFLQMTHPELNSPKRQMVLDEQMSPRPKIRRKSGAVEDDDPSKVCARINLPLDLVPYGTKRRMDHQQASRQLPPKMNNNNNHSNNKGVHFGPDVRLHQQSRMAPLQRQTSPAEGATSYQQYLSSRLNSSLPGMAVRSSMMTYARQTPHVNQQTSTSNYSAYRPAIPVTVRDGATTASRRGRGVRKGTIATSIRLPTSTSRTINYYTPRSSNASSIR